MMQLNYNLEKKRKGLRGLAMRLSRRALPSMDEALISVTRKRGRKTKLKTYLI